MSQAHPPPSIRYPRPMAHIAPFVDVLGPELAIEFLLTFGGATMQFPRTPGGQSRVEALIGAARLAALFDRLGGARIRVPIGNTWLVPAMDAQGVPRAEIARRVRCSDVSVARLMRRAKERLAEGKPV